VEGRTVTIETRWSEGNPKRVAEIAAEFVRQKVDVIVAYGGAVTIVKQATASIPIVFPIAQEPKGIGLVTNLSHPGGNVTGLSMQSTETASKRIELLREAAPRLHRLAILFDAGYVASVREKDEAQAAARVFDLEPTPYGITRAEDISEVFAALKGAKRTHSTSRKVPSLVQSGRKYSLCLQWIRTCRRSVPLPMAQGGGCM
jgi:putative ABC transport system substrate-binding protein